MVRFLGSDYSFLWVHAVGQDVFSRSQDFTKGFSDMEY